MENLDKLHKEKNRIKTEYNRQKYKQLKAFIQPSDYKIIDEHCKSKGISKARFIVKACRYCIEKDVELN